ncbi:MAG: HAMP domain-containing histidine kinase [Oscillospiraceae bacterium]|nr:HAMP domain-containing histidine kinase [Oscillospiraceae bacterium]
MTLKKRIVRSNMLMLLIPLAIIILIVRFLPGIIIDMYGGWVPGNNVFHAQNQIHRILHDKGQFNDRVIASIERKGYMLLITDGGQTVYSSLSEQAEDIAEEIMDEPAFSKMSVFRNTAVIRESRMIESDRLMTVIAVHTEYRDSMIMQERVEEALSLVGPVTVLVSLIVILLTNRVLMNKMLKSIIEPLDILRSGTRQIRDGNLDFDFSRSGDDEFKAVFDDFEDMRRRLQGSVSAQLKAEESRKALLAGISHDLRTPLTVIKGYAEGLNDGVAVTAEKREKYLSTIYKKACELDFLVDQLFLFSKMDMGGYPFSFNKADLAVFVDRFAEMAADEFGSRGLKVTFEKCNEPMPVLIDAAEFSRVLVNVVSNSEKYVKNEAPECKINLSKQGESARLVILDNGNGVAEENLDKLFESFYREDVSRCNTEKGSGLGLSIAKQIIEAHGGSVRAYNNGGLAIEIHIPLCKEES